MSKKKTFWPYGILLSLFAIVLACIATIVFASQYPVYEDKVYFQTYQEVDENINEIRAKQEIFEKFFSVSLDLNSSKDKKGRVVYDLNQDQNTLRFVLKDKIENISSKFSAELLLTRPHTNEQDAKLGLEILQNTGINSNVKEHFINVVLPRLEKGRWQLQLKIIADKDDGINTQAVGFYTYEIFVR
ncbi:FixH family protein [Campylobacter sp. US33a]|uniref:FixH family protein n=1 Tax=Campylobacter sp. US33a TaxID=2498120 RepID=UPI0010678753|nr:FixH family protein [Campylobacter sp. US33a]TEY04507.1 hypothetical protein ELQ16_00320 [Campylobacter sp. US33a]